MSASMEIIPPTDGKLLDLAAEIRVEHEAVIGSFKSGLDHALKCGDLLYKAKKIAGHGGWLNWFRANRWISARTASDYMRLAAGRSRIEAKSAEAADLTIQAALRLLSPPKSQPCSTTAAIPAPSSPSSEKQLRQPAPAKIDFPPLLRATPENQTDEESAAAEEFRAIICHMPPDDLMRLMKLATKFTLILGPAEGWGNRPKYCAIYGDLLARPA